MNQPVPTKPSKPPPQSGSWQMLGCLAILPVFAFFYVCYRWRKKKKEIEQDRGKDDVMQKIENDHIKQELTEGVGKHDNDKHVISVKSTESEESNLPKFV